MNKRQATALWSKLEKSLFDFESTLKRIIAEKAWEPLGYETFFDAWNDKMTHLDVSKLLLPHIVYQMFDEGFSDDRVAETVKGVGPTTVKNLRRQKKNNVPADSASTIVREHKRKVPYGEHSHLRIDVGAERFSLFQKIAKQADLTIDEIAIPALDFAFSEIQRVNKESA